MVSRTLTTQRVGAAVTSVAVALAVLLVLVHGPKTVHDLAGIRRDNDTLDLPGRSYQKAADSLAIDNGFVAAAAGLAGGGTRYAVVGPPPAAVAADQIPAIAYESLEPFLRSILLPSLPTTLRRATYVLCYRCRPVPGHVSWLWQDSAGDRIGRRTSGS